MGLTQKQLLDTFKNKKHIIIWSDDDTKIGIKYAYQGFTVYEIPTVIDFMMKQFMADRNQEIIEKQKEEEEGVDYMG